MTISEAQAKVLQSIADGEHEMEAGYPYENPLNDRQRELIAAYQQEHGECWLGRINIYRDEELKPVVWKWDGGLVCNFEARFVLPRYDADLERMILARHAGPYTTTDADYKLVKAIHARIRELGGDVLIWN